MHYNLTYAPSSNAKPLYLDEQWLIDDTYYEFKNLNPQDKSDNVQVFIPLNLNKYQILRRLDRVISEFGAASERNEFAYRRAVEKILTQLEIFDQIWCERMSIEDGKHYSLTIEIAEKVIKKLEAIPDACAECFPFETIDELKEEYLQEK